MTRKKKRLRTVPGAIPATPERMRQAGYAYDELAEATAGGMLRKTGAVKVWSQLENLYRNRRLTGGQRDAGERFYADWYLAGFAPRVTSSMAEWVQNMSGGHSNLDAAERRVFHAKRYAAANTLLEELGVRKALHLFVINDIPAEHIGRSIQGYRGQRAATASGVTMISLGLARLVKFYGLEK